MQEKSYEKNPVPPRYASLNVPKSSLIIALFISFLLFSLLQIPCILLPAEAAVPVSSNLLVKLGTEARQGDTGTVLFTLRSDSPRDFYALAVSTKDHGLTFRDTPLQLGDPIFLLASGEVPNGQREVTLQFSLPLTLLEGTYYLQGAFAEDPSFETNVSLTNGISLEVRRSTVPDSKIFIENRLGINGVAVNSKMHVAILTFSFSSEAVVVDLLSGSVSNPFRVVSEIIGTQGVAIDIDLTEAIFVSSLPAAPRDPPLPITISIVDLSTRTIDKELVKIMPPVQLIKNHQSLHKTVMGNRFNTGIHLLNLLTHELSEISLSDPPIAFASAERSGSMFIAHEGKSFVTEVSLITDTVLRTFDVGMEVEGIAISDRLNRLYGWSSNNNILKSLDLETGTLMAQTTLPGFGRAPLIRLAINDNAGIGAATLVGPDLRSLVIFDLNSLIFLNELSPSILTIGLDFDDMLNILVSNNVMSLTVIPITDISPDIQQQLDSLRILINPKSYAIFLKLPPTPTGGRPIFPAFPEEILRNFPPGPPPIPSPPPPAILPPGSFVQPRGQNGPQ